MLKCSVFLSIKNVSNVKGGAQSYKPTAMHHQTRLAAPFSSLFWFFTAHKFTALIQAHRSHQLCSRSEQAAVVGEKAPINTHNYS